MNFIWSDPQDSRLEEGHMKEGSEQNPFASREESHPFKGERSLKLLEQTEELFLSYGVTLQAAEQSVLCKSVPNFSQDQYCRIMMKPQELLYCGILHICKSCCDLLSGQSLQYVPSFTMLLLSLLLFGLKQPDDPR